MASFADLVNRLKTLEVTVARGAVTAAANEMASNIQQQIQNVTLRETSHPPYTFYHAPAGRPPAYASGNLARSIVFTPAGSGVVAKANVGATARYAAIQEFGGTTWPNHSRYLHWRNPSPWWKKRVVVPEHPYFRPTVEKAIISGDLTRWAMKGFWSRVSPLLS